VLSSEFAESEDRPDRSKPCFGGATGTRPEQCPANQRQNANYSEMLSGCRSLRQGELLGLGSTLTLAERYSG
jgi:hypothetical protein